MTPLTPDELDELRRELEDPRHEDLEGIAYACRWLLEERAANEPLVDAAAKYRAGALEAHERVEGMFAAAEVALRVQPLPESSGARRRAAAQRLRMLQTVAAALELAAVARAK